MKELVTTGRYYLIQKYEQRGFGRCTKDPTIGRDKDARMVIKVEDAAVESRSKNLVTCPITLDSRGLCPSDGNTWVLVLACAQQRLQFIWALCSAPQSMAQMFTFLLGGEARNCNVLIELIGSVGHRQAEAKEAVVDYDDFQFTFKIAKDVWPSTHFVPCIVVDTERMSTDDIDLHMDFMKGALLIDLSVYFGGMHKTCRMHSRAQLEGMHVGKEYLLAERLIRLYETLIMEAPRIRTAQASLAQSEDPVERSERIVKGTRLFYRADA